MLERGQTAFLDRDGTINTSPREGQYIERPEQLTLEPFAGKAIALLNRTGIHTVVVTNQRGIARGLMTEADLAAVHEQLVELLAAEGARVDGILHCPHQVGECRCRKPGPGMFERAEREIEGVRISGSAMVGDSDLDVLAGSYLGISTVRVGPTASEASPVPTFSAPTLWDAVQEMVGN